MEKWYWFPILGVALAIVLVLIYLVQRSKSGKGKKSETNISGNLWDKLKSAWMIAVLLIGLPIAGWALWSGGRESLHEDIAENYHYLDLKDDGFEDRVMTPIMANPVFGEGPPNILDPNNRTRLRRIVIPILHPGNNPGACRILRMINCAEDYSYRFILKTTGIYQGDEYTEKRTWRVGDPPVDCDPPAVAVEIWVERERPGMAGALVNFWQCKVNC